MKLLLILITASVIFISCSQKKDDSSTSDTKQTVTENKSADENAVKFSDKSFLKTYNNCQPDDTCTYFKIDYIEAVSGNNADKINKLITNIVNGSLAFGEKSVTNMQTAADTFMAQYVSMRKEFPESPQYWYLELSVSANQDHPKIINISSGMSSFMGGAHPNSYIEYYNINRETGDTLSLGNLFTAGFEKKLNELIDAKFRKDNKIAAGESLSDKGGLFENKISFNYNWMISKDGSITFFYNPYEIASYAQGPIEVTLTKEEIAPLLSESSPLK